MAKRLQVILQEHEYREIRHLASAREISPAEWVRQALDVARRRESLGDIGKKLEAIHAAARHDYPVGDIGDMTAEIKRKFAPDGS